jgi:hypothetical protein
MSRKHKVVNIFVETNKGGNSLNSIATKFFDTNSTKDILSHLKFARGLEKVENLKIDKLITSFSFTTKKFTYAGHVHTMYDFALTPELELNKCESWVTLGTGKTSSKGYFDQMNIRCGLRGFPSYTFMHIVKTNKTERHMMRFVSSEYTWGKVTKEVFKKFKTAYGKRAKARPLTQTGYFNTFFDMKDTYFHELSMEVFYEPKLMYIFTADIGVRDW